MKISTRLPNAPLKTLRYLQILLKEIEANAFITN